MRTILILIAAVCALGASVGATATGQGGTLGGGWAFALGLEYQRVFEQDLELDSGRLQREEMGIRFSGHYPAPGNKIESPELDSSRMFAVATLGVHPRLDLFFKLGVAETDWEYRDVEPGVSDDKYTFDGDRDTTWAIGLRAKLYEAQNGLRLMARAQYLSHDSDGATRVNGRALAGFVADELTAAGATDVLLRDASATDTEELEAALYASRDFGLFTPYLGVEYRRIDVDGEFRVFGSEGGGVPFSQTITQSLETDQKLNLLVGTDARFLNNQLVLNAEASLLGSPAVSAGLHWKF